ncbi:hypothetical protein GAPWK_2390 [Gilliamella apicola]|uniref:hypothetical protein n=1 Tax=Gilliamella apicola TaxID=1196095 RepID=UPI00042E4ACA|nr:hypothetical protein [Gilliamella apicola]AHN26963.1 hypothetical protein GAPWK_2390 [Gilliamella apicola]PXV94062.1 hypothetical protein C7392_106104 [Gilliamella apicola]
MKLSQYTIVLFCLLFSITSSYAEINIEKCKTNESDYIIFDEYDSQIAEKIIDYKLHNQPEKRESSIIKIFANENSDDRNYWLASFQFDDQTQQYLFFQVEPETFIEIDKNQFEALLPKIVECNQNQQTPIYSENFDED